MRSAQLRGSGGAIAWGAGILILIFLITMVQIQFGLFLPRPNGNAVPPNIPLSSSEKPVLGTDVSIAGQEYAIWDIRDANTNMLKFMTVSDPNTGTINGDSNLESHAFAVRIAFQIASDIKSINDFESGSSAGNKISGMIESALVLLTGTGQSGAVVTAIQDTATVTTSLVTIAGSTSDSANNLVSNPSDQNADLFLTKLDMATGVSASQKLVAFSVLISSAFVELHIPTGPLFQTMYEDLTLGTNPSLSVTSATFGALEESQTNDALAARGL
jgi:hypothetical protein